MSPILVKCVSYSADLQTGVCLGLQLGPYRICLDCGITDLSGLQIFFSQPNDGSEQGASKQPADFMLCSQAHMDHVRGFAEFHHRFPTIPIFTSVETQQLLSHLYADGWASACQTIPWNTAVALATDLTLEFIPAGQLPGAAVCLLTYTAHSESGPPESHTVAYTGDFYLTHTRFAAALPTASLKDRSLDLLMVKGGYGTQQHPPRKHQESELIQRLLQALAAKISILIPVPHIGLGQEILMLLRTHAEFAHQQVTIWVDEPVVQGCEAYAQILPSLPASIRNFARQQSLFWQATGRLQIQALGSISQRPCILLVHHQTDLAPYAPILGEQVLVLESIPPESPQILRDLPAETGSEVAGYPTSWQTETFLLAQACDGPSITQLIHNSRPRHVVFYHPSPLVLEDLIQVPDLQNRYQLHTLMPGKCLELEIEDQISPPQVSLTPPLQTYVGELLESPSAVTLSLGADILDDPRWQTFADTGLIEAVWQGHQLVIRGLSPAEILRSSVSQNNTDRDRICCANCYYYRNQRCWHTESALYGFKVAPQGTCPVYIAMGNRSMESDEFERVPTDDDGAIDH